MSEPATSASAKDKIIDIGEVEAAIEANVQKSLDSFDAWKVVEKLRAQEKNPCTREKHNCNMDGEIKNMCLGCIMYRNIVLNRSTVPVGGRSDICDYFATNIVAPLILAFAKESNWLSPMSELSGRWFIKYPITYASRPTSSLVPDVQVMVRRNKIRIYEAEDLLKQFSVTGENVEKLFDHINNPWTTNAGGKIYILDEFLDTLGPIHTIAQKMCQLGLESISFADLINGAKLFIESQ
jgi:hypothetical protein